MSELDVRLRSGLTALAERIEPATSADDLIANLGRPGRRSRGVVVRVAVAAAVVLAIVVTVVALRRGDDSDHAVVDVGPSPTTVAPPPEWHPTGLEAGWHELPPGPLGALYPRAMVWTGSELILWRGEGGAPDKMARAASFAPAVGEWTELPPDPLDVGYLSGVGVGGAWTGTEAVFWAPAGVVAWNPAAQEWRTASSSPHTHEREAIWTGSEVVFWADGLAYDPHADRWREVALPSEPLRLLVYPDDDALLWTGTEIVVVGGLSGAYDVATDTWREFGPPLTEKPNATIVAWDGGTARVTRFGDEIVAFDFTPDSTASLDLAQGTWTERPDLAPPIDPSGTLTAVPFDDGRVLLAGGNDVQLRNLDRTWSSYRSARGALVGTGDAVFEYGSRETGPFFGIFVPPGWDASLGSGWYEFDRGPLPVDRSPQAVAYDDRRSALYLFGFRGADDVTENRGLVFRPQTGEWSDIPSAPLDTLDGLDGMFHDESFVVWSQAGVAFWDPEHAQWRAGSPAPRSLRRSPWLPDNPALAAPDLIWWADGLVYDMRADQWREIARPPSVPTRASAVYDANELFVVGLADERVPTVTAQYAYSPSADAWRELPPTGLNGQALDLLWLGQDVQASILGVDYQGNAVVYDAVDLRWRAIDRVPIDFGEGDVELTRIGRGAFLSSSWGFALLDVEVRGREVVDLRWRRLESDFPPGGRPINRGAAVFVLGDRIRLFAL